MNEQVARFFKETERQLEDILRYGRDVQLPFHSPTKEQIEWFKNFASKGNCLAQTALGWYYYNNENTVKGLKLLERASNQGYSPAQYLLGEHHTHSLKKSELFQKSADQGCASAQYRLATIYFRQDNVEKSNELYHKSADQGNVAAKNFLGQCHFHGMNGCEKSYQLAVEYFRQAAEFGSLAGMNNLGLCYFQGLGVEQSYVKSARYFMEASEQNYDIAKNNLGMTLLNVL